MIERKDHVGLFAFADQSGDEEDREEILLPEDMTDEVAVSNDDLQELHDRLVASFDDLNDNGEDTVETIETMTQLADAIDSVRSEQTRRTEAAAEREAARSALADRIRSQGDEDEDENEAEEEAEEAPAEEPGAAPVGTPEAEAPAPVPEPQPEPVPVAAATQPRVPATVKPRRINVPLSEVRRRAPTVALPRPSQVVTASDVPGFHAGQNLNTLLDLAKAIAERSRTTPVTASGNISGPKVASITRDFEHTLSLDSSHEQVEAIMKAVTNQDSLVAAGGWCAPSEIMYDFFNIADEDGLLDLPTVGIARGGVRFPASPSIADVFGNVWLWTETDDIATITGGPNKP